MGVIPCDRVGCDNIMCDRSGYYGGEHYRICNDCFEELVCIGPHADVKLFMDGLLHLTERPDASRAYWNEIFPRSTSHETS